VKKKVSKVRIPAGMMADLVNSVREVRARATLLRQPEAIREDQLLEHETKKEME